MIPLSVMTFNLRYGTAKDGENAWEHRRDLLVQTLADYQPNVIGTQEGLDFQLAYITSKLPRYRHFGVSRRGDTTDEHSAILYDASRLSLEEGGNFWLSETPDLPASKSWDSSHSRMVTWAKLAISDHDRGFYCLNTHFDHRSETARQRSARLVLERTRGLDPHLPLFITGDFNTIHGEKTWNIFVGREALDGESGELIDAWSEAPIRTGGVMTTFHGFKGEAVESRRWQDNRWLNGAQHIDWILCRPGVRVKSAEIVTANQNGRYPSDHYPVYVEVELPV